MKRIKFHTYEEFEQALKLDVPTPRRELTVQQLLSKPSQGRRALHKKGSIITSVCFCFALAAGASAATWDGRWLLRDKTGETTLEMTQTPEEQIKKDEKAREIMELPVWQRKMEDIRQSLQPGETAILLIAEAYEISRYYYPVQKDTVYTSIEQLRQATDTGFPIPAPPPGQLFSEGRITFESDSITFTELESLYRTAKNSEQGYVVERMQQSRQAASIWYSYNRSGKTPILPGVSVNIQEATGSIMSSRLSSAAEVVQIKETEALFIPDSVPNLTVIIEHNKKNLQYTFSSSMTNEKNLEQTKEELIEMAKSILN